MNILDKTRLLQTSILSTLIMGAAVPAFAQVAPPAEADDETASTAEQIETQDVADEDEFESDMDTIVVTGSRLRRNEFTSASPLQVIDGELARDLGNVDAADLLGQTTVVQGQQISTGISTSAFGPTQTLGNGPGSATASLRGLTAGRTLVLVNGRRLAPAGVRGVPSAPDINLIPGTLIERVDVLLDGASSVYGSDAVAGVVNYVLRDNFDGIQLDGYHSFTQFPDNEGQQYVMTASGGVSNDRGFVGFAVEHSKTKGVTQRSIGTFYDPYAEGCLPSIVQGASGTIYSPDTCGNGTFGAGAVSGHPGGFLFYEDGARTAGLPDNYRFLPVTADLIQPDNPNGIATFTYPEAFDAAFTPDFERTSIYTVGEYDTGFYGDMTAYFEASHAFRSSNTNTSGQGAIPISPDYALNPFFSAVDAGVPVNQFYSARIINDSEVAQTRIIGGLRGDLPFLEKAGLSNWGYDTYASYSRSSGQDSVEGIPFVPRLIQTQENTFINADGEAECANNSVPTGQAVQCRPLDFTDPTFLFTGRFQDDEDNAYLFPNRLTDTIVQQAVYSLYVSGDVFDLPWGDTILAGFGAEYREDTIETNTSLSGDFQGATNDPGSNGSRNLAEVFGEIEIPLVRDKPFFEDLTINASARYTDESNFGAEETWSVKGVYSPTTFLTFRGTYGTSYRAPDLGQQFGGSVTSLVNPADPCRVPGLAVPFGDYDNDPSTPDTREYVAANDQREDELIQRCLNGGGPFNIPGTDPFSLGVSGLGTPSPVFTNNAASVASGSNPNLRPETSDAYSAGAVFEQNFTDSFDFRASATYFRIEIQDEIDSLTSATIINRCYNDPNLADPTCALLTRSPRVPGDQNSGEITNVAAIQQNLGEQIVDGIDYNAEFGFDFTPSFTDSPIDYRFIGRATQSLTQTEEEFLADGINVDDALGEFGNPEWRLNLTNVLRWKDLSLLFQSRYIGSQIESNEDAEDPVTSPFSNCVQAGDTPCLQFDDLDDYWVHNMSISYSQDTFVFRAGVNNLFNDAPPLTNNNGLNTLGGIGYDLNGRSFFVNATKRF